MPQIVKADTPNKSEKLTKLKDLKVGDVFRFPSVSFEQAITNEEGANFFFLMETPPPKKTGRVTIVSSDFKITLEKDDDREVVVHHAKLHVEPAELV